MKNQDILENQVKNVFLSIGSNLGNKKNNIDKAKKLIEDSKTIVVKTSRIYETQSWPNPKFPKYLNIILNIKTFQTPLSLFNKIKLIEKKLGRKKTKRNFPRKCDIDIIDYNRQIFNLTTNLGKVKIPHPRLKNRNFVLFPLYEVSKNWSHPKSNENIADLIVNLSKDNLTGIKLI